MLSRSSSSWIARSTYGLTLPAASVTLSLVLAILGGSFRLLARGLVPLGLLFILSACGHSAQREHASTRLVRGTGFSFSVPRAWRTRRTERAVVAQKGSALVSVTTYALVKPYTPALFDRAAAELDRVAARLAREVHGTLSERAT